MGKVHLAKDDLEKGQQLLLQGKVAELYYSHGTYQVRVDDSEDPLWTLMQLDDNADILDGFCGCQEDEGVSCPHLAASFLKVVDQNGVPMHVRFEKSFWKHLCALFTMRFGDRTDVLKKTENGYELFSEEKQTVVFTIQSKKPESLQFLEDTIDHRQRETEETSLKFSNLSPEDLSLWKEGRPTFDLRFELSFWSDLAKWFFDKQENKEKCKISFKYDDRDIPSLITVDWASVSCTFFIDEEGLFTLIPSLNTVASPLSIYAFHEKVIEKINYDENKAAFHVITHEEEIKEDWKSTSPIKMGSWWYLPKKGFISIQQHDLVLKPVISEEKINETLNDHSNLFARHLDKVTLYKEPVTLQQTLFFDDKWNLHVQTYYKTPGDLHKAPNRFFGDWVYLSKQGFYPVENVPFRMAELVVEVKDMGKFIDHHRTWLNTQPGFQTHLTHLESRLSYKILPNGTLKFLAASVLNEGQSFDFGQWVYFQEEGFYAKTGRPDYAARADLEIQSRNVGDFVSKHADELELINNFFSLNPSPVRRMGVTIKLTPKHQVVIAPYFELFEEVNPKKVRFYDGCVYQEGQGFHLLATDGRLPVRFRREKTIEKEQLNYFLTQELASLRPFAISIDPRLEVPLDLKLTLQHIEQNTQGKLDLELFYRSEYGQVALSDVWEAVQKRQPYLFTNAGYLDLHDKRYIWLRSLHGDQIEENHIQISTWEYLRLNGYEDIDTSDSDQEEFINALLKMQALSKPDLKGLHCSLRPYQEIGVDWLWFLYTFGLSGLLCDEMGLGKTHQAMALLEGVTNQLSRPPHFLIVCPISVIYHWEEKLKEFMPHLPVHHFHGIKRSLDDFKKHNGVLLTSYGVVRAEREAMKQFSFDVAIFDEIQVAKNHHSKTYAALVSLKAGMRLGLTGTPIENQIRELKALFDIVLPAYMPGETQYRDLFVNPIEKESDSNQKALLTKIVKPFILRRKKDEVLKDLPEKVETISYCELSAKQKELYKEAVEGVRHSLMQELNDEEKPVPYMSFLKLMTQLKQICDHPAVVFKDPKNYHHYSSGKWQLFLELLMEARESEQKVVVFSHYLFMLDIIQLYLEENEIGFAAVRGDTVNRRDELLRFRQDPKCEVFVGSLGAVGLGVDLTAASVVIHYDRWWNAARENQATDRVHRIGQKRGVQVFKLITKGTIEEYLHQMIMQKGSLMEEIVSSDDAGTFKRLDRQELLALLKLIEKYPQ
ncbi:MAG: DEAD/DEAH box helicase [Parachlamydiales bacterium]|nr:DEAD/DEAH box helicase [Parachlamydiales bacterium]